MKCRPLLLQVLFVFLMAAGLIGIENHAWAKESPTQKCGGCHKKYTEDWLPTKHGKIFLNNPQNDLQARACEACHGDGTNHIANAKKASEEIGGKVDLSLIRRLTKQSSLSAHEKNDVCLQCHQKEARRYLWEGSKHEASGVACVDCHQYTKNVKMVKLRDDRNRSLESHVDASSELCVSCHTQRRAQFMRTSHMPYREGKMKCADCHNPHGGTGPSLLKTATVNENCYSCHQEKRGPLLWEHAPVRENCSTCHDPHGSNYPTLLKIKQPYLCQTCHAVQFHPSTLYSGGGLPGVATSFPTDQQLGKSCLNCHTKVHGSNHPSGQRFTR